MRENRRSTRTRKPEQRRQQPRDHRVEFLGPIRRTTTEGVVKKAEGFIPVFKEKASRHAVGIQLAREPAKRGAWIARIDPMAKRRA